jgi:phosphohistidine swiveling domain-containing protein
MELTIATLNEILLPPFLFIVTFCFLCCQLRSASYTIAIQQPETEAVATPQTQTETVEEVEAEQESAVEEHVLDQPQPDTPVVETLENVPAEIEAEETVTSVSAVNSLQPELCTQVLAVIDNLGKREARKIMGALKLQQKRNGVELSTELMVASIKREFKASPDRVIEAIRDRLPELLSNATSSEPDQLAS